MAFLFLVTGLILPVFSEKVDCRSFFCQCRENGHCEIYCDSFTNQCKSSSLLCTPGYPCTVYCGGKSACDTGRINGNGATDVTLLCAGGDACKSSTFLCGTGQCNLDCVSPTDCQDTSVEVGSATGFNCVGYCQESKGIPMPVIPVWPWRTQRPTLRPTVRTTPRPTVSPTVRITPRPTTSPTSRPTKGPTLFPTRPTLIPTNAPLPTFPPSVKVPPPTVPPSKVSPPTFPPSFLAPVTTVPPSKVPPPTVPPSKVPPPTVPTFPLSAAPLPTFPPSMAPIPTLPPSKVPPPTTRPPTTKPPTTRPPTTRPPTTTTTTQPTPSPAPIAPRYLSCSGTKTACKCSDFQPCVIQCDTVDSCIDSLLVCPRQHDCTVECSDKSCNKAAITGPTNANFVLKCTGTSSCTDLMVDTADAKDVNAVCSGKDSCKGAGTTIHCGSGICNLQFTGEASGADAQINTNLAIGFQCGGRYAPCPPNYVPKCPGIGAAACTAAQVFNEETCQCECPYLPKAAMLCPAAQAFDTRTCQCEMNCPWRTPTAAECESQGLVFRDCECVDSNYCCLPDPVQQDPLQWAGICWRETEKSSCEAVPNARCIWDPLQCLSNPPRNYLDPSKPCSFHDILCTMDSDCCSHTCLSNGLCK